ncbi:UNVERIFIED_CONTAM: hypothetical protein PYX00_009219 [Menopon gallinae]|uniref:Uncharacterized protein n=1 Tax=Menopon gallinae TaxID=328185 RepID=A0AAW2HAJ9_9NEOP
MLRFFFLNFVILFGFSLTQKRILESENSPFREEQSNELRKPQFMQKIFALFKSPARTEEKGSKQDHRSKGKSREYLIGDYDELNKRVLLRFRRPVLSVEMR